MEYMTMIARKDTVGTHKTAVYTDSNGDLCVKYHTTVVWRKTPGGMVTLDNGGWQTVTTAKRIDEAFRQFCPDAQFYVCQRKGEWLLGRYMGNGIHLPLSQYHNGMVIDTTRGQT